VNFIFQRMAPISMSTACKCGAGGSHFGAVVTGSAYHLRKAIIFYPVKKQAPVLAGACWDCSLANINMAVIRDQP
jgi:hypothetical protein